MSSDHKYVNFDEYYEIRDWLIKNKYSGSGSNRRYLRVVLAPIIKWHFNKTSAQHLTWEELDEYHETFPSEFENLEKLDNK